MGTFKALRSLVRRYGFTRDHGAASRAAEYLFGWQTLEGDFRGFIGDQYATYYTGETIAVLTLCGYGEDPRIHRDLDWLISMRQGDGGWTIPLLTHRYDRETGYRIVTEPCAPVAPDWSKPFSHNWTDMALRAFAVHPGYRGREEALHAAGLLKSRFFQPDAYASYRDPGYWVRFQFWWPNIVTSLDSLSRLGFSRSDHDIRAALDWLVGHQRGDGLGRQLHEGKEAERHAAYTREGAVASPRDMQGLQKFLRVKNGSGLEDPLLRLVAWRLHMIQRRYRLVHAAPDTQVTVHAPVRVPLHALALDVHLYGARGAEPLTVLALVALRHVEAQLPPRAGHLLGPLEGVPHRRRLGEKVPKDVAKHLRHHDYPPSRPR